MKVLQKIADFLECPVETIVEWFDSMGEFISEWWNTLLDSALEGMALFVIDGISVLAVCYAIYCTYRIMCTSKDEKFSEYINKSMIAGLAYFFAKCGGKFVLNFIGGM